MNIETIQSVYFVGAGGIGMSALIRYFLSLGKRVAGYDRTPSELTARLVEEERLFIMKKMLIKYQNGVEMQLQL